MSDGRRPATKRLSTERSALEAVRSAVERVPLYDIRRIVARPYRVSRGSVNTTNGVSSRNTLRTDITVFEDVVSFSASSDPPRGRMSQLAAVES